MEIERKFLVETPPDLTGSEPIEIEQGYLAVGADEVRLRRMGAERLLTVKRGAGMSREELEVPLPSESFERLWPLTESRRIRKRRHAIPCGRVSIELDVFEGECDGLLIAEAEFPSEEDARSFDPPGWLGSEITGDRDYLNATLACQGPPG